MSREIDTRVVEMQFDNKRFEQNAQNTISTLEKLKESLKFGNASKGFYDINNAAKSVDLSAIEKGVAVLADRFSTLGIVGMTVIQNLTNGVMGLVKSISGKIYSGGLSRALKIEQARFMIQGLDADFKKLSADIDYAVSGTAYGFDAAANAAAQLTASGVKAGDEMKDALRGISGVAAMTGSSYEDISEIFTTVAGNGKLMTQQLRQFSFRGLNASATLAKSFNKINDASSDMSKKTSEETKKAIKSLTGGAKITEQTINELVTEGAIDFRTFSEVMDLTFGEHAKEADRTFSGASANINAALSRIGAAIITPLVLTREYDEKTGELVKGQENLIDVMAGIKRIFNAVQTTIENSKAFQLYTGLVQKASAAISQFLYQFTQLNDAGKWEFAKISDSKNIKNLRDTFRGLFAAVDLVRIGIVKLGEKLSPVVKIFKFVISTILSATAAIGRFIVHLNKAAKGEVELFTKTSKLSTIFKHVVDRFKSFGNIFAKGNPFLSIGDKLTESFSGFGGKLKGKTIFGALGDKLIEGFKSTESIANRIITGFRKLGELISKSLSAMFGEIGKAEVKFLDIVNTGLFVTLLAGFKKLMDFFTTGRFLGKESIINVGNIERILSQVAGSLQQFQNTLKSKQLLNIALAIGVLAVSLMLLSGIDGPKLTKALTAIAALFTELLTAFLFFSRIIDQAGFNALDTVKWKAMSIGLIAMSAAILIMGLALKVMEDISWEDMTKGLLAVITLMGSMLLYTNAIGKMKTRGVLKASVAMIFLGTALRIIAPAIKDIGSLDIETIGKGLAAIGGLLAGMAGFAKIASGSKGILTASVGMIAIAYAMKMLLPTLERAGQLEWMVIGKGMTVLGGSMAIMAAGLRLIGHHGPLGGIGILAIAKAMEMLVPVLIDASKLSWKEIGKGMSVFGGAIVGMTVALKVLGNSGVIGGAGILLVAKALQVLSGPLFMFSKMNMKAIGKSMLVLAGSLTAMALAIKIIGPSGITGAASLFIISTSLVVLAKAMKMLANMKPGQIVKALLALVGMFTVLGVAAALLAPLTPVIISLSGALMLLGGAIFLAGAGIALFAGGIAILAGVTAAGISSIISVITALIGTIPLIAKAFANGILETLKALSESAPQLVASGLTLLLAFLDGLRQKLPDIMEFVAELITTFINTVAGHIGEIIDAGFNLMINFINGLADALDNNSERLGEAIKNLVLSIIAAILDILAELLSMIPIVGEDIEEALNGAADGIRSNKSLPEAGKEKGKETVEAMSGELNKTDKIKKSGNKTAEAYGKGIESRKQFTSHRARDLANVTDQETAKAKEYLTKNGENAAKGFVNGLGSMMDSIREKAAKMAKEAKDASAKELEERSPSRAFMRIGMYATEGFIIGLGSMNARVAKTGQSVADEAITSVSEALLALGDKYENLDAFQPTITPVVDLSNVNASARTIASLFGETPIGMAKALDASATLNTGTNSNDIVSAINGLSFKMEALERSMETNNVDPELIYAAVQAGASDANIGVRLNNRELSRELRHMGVNFA